MELFIFARLYAREGQEVAVIAAMREMVGPTRAEPGCMGVDYYRSIRDPRLFYVHSRWTDEAAFDRHVGLPHTVRFVEEVEKALVHSLEVARTTAIDGIG
ncbi:MAG TPA: putative quinol monooxygenase [Haliangiales bacterium]|nr:putative quinol monooxygenase [Haliangiales bacterium]